MNTTLLTDHERPTMIETVKTALTRSQPTLWQDALGALSLVVILLGALHLPGLL